MNNRERVLASLAHEQPDRTPFNLGFTAKAEARMAEHVGDPDFRDKLDVALWVMGTQLPKGPDPNEPDIWEDEFGVRWNRSVDKDIGVVCNRLVTGGTIDDYEFPDPAHPDRWEQYPRALAAHTDRFRVANLGFSLFERAWTLYGMQELLMDMVADPAAVHRLLDRITEYNLEIIERACACDVDAMMFGDDWGSQGGVIMGVDLWREFVKPRVRRMYGAVRDHGKFVFIHSCGKVDELFPDLIECGLHCFNPFQPEVMDVFAMKETFGSRLTFFGGISTQRTLPYGTPDDVRREVRKLLEVVGSNGGLIASPAHDIPGDARPENIAAMIEVLQEQ